MDTDLLPVCHIVQEAIETLSSSQDSSQISRTLQTVKSYLDKTVNPASVKEQEEFTGCHFTPFLHCLMKSLSPDWPGQFRSEEEKELWASFFLEGPADQSFMVLLDAIISTRSSFCLDKLADVLEQFLRRDRLLALMWEVCKRQTHVGTPVLQEAILGRIVSLPDHLANKLQGENRPIFFPQNYFPLLGVALVQVLERISDSLRDGLDCSISFVSQVLGKGCALGRKQEILSVLVPHLIDRTQSDCIWQRMSWRLVESVPDRWMEAVVCGFVQSADGSAALTRLLGNLVLKSKKAHFVMTQKLLLFQYNFPTAVLETLLGYLALESRRRCLLIEVFKELLEIWGSSCSMKYYTVQQRLYISKAILICLSHLKEEEITSNRQEFLTNFMEGMKCHLDSNSPRIRLIGMVVAECLSKKITSEGPALKFQYEEDEEIKELKSLLTEKPEEISDGDEPRIKNGILAAGLREVPKPRVKEVPAASKEAAQGTDSESDSDDELIPYDMSHDKELKKTKAPTYLRECLEILTGPEDADKYEAAMTVLETLVRKNAAAVREMGVELVKVLLHLEEKNYIKGFVWLRQSAMAAIVAIDPVPVAQYLTSEFYSLNYSLHQRMDILHVLVMAAQELSQPVSPESKQPPQSNGNRIPLNGSSSDWQKVVEERIKSKTRRFAKGRSQAEPQCVPNRFGLVAGHFFFPLLQNFDRPLSTFDLLGEDHLVLGRLAHTLAILMHFAVNTVVATVMGKALLEFVWVLRFHSDTYVRQGLLSCVLSLVLSLPAEHLLEDMAEELLETRVWLADVAEKDPDDESRRLAVQNLLLIENLKKRLESPNP